MQKLDFCSKITIKILILITHVDKEYSEILFIFKERLTDIE